MKRTLALSAALLLVGLPFFCPVASAQNAASFQENIAHTGSISFATGFNAPLKRKWTRNLGGPVDYPLIVNDYVFVVVGNTGNYGSHLMALNLKTGGIIWDQPIGGTYYSSYIAYDNKRVFDMNTDGLVRTFAADRAGTLLWSSQLPWQYSFEFPPIATDGKVFAAGGGVAGNAYALSEKTGKLLWSTFLFQGQDGSPAFADGSLYLGFVCNYYKLNSETGKLLWLSDRSECGGGGSRPPVFYDNQVFQLDTYTVSTPVLLNAANGKIVRQIDASYPPAIWAGPSALAIAPDQSEINLTATEVSSGNTAWSFQGDGVFQLSPIVINNVVAVGSVNGTLYLLDAASGKELWSTNVGAPIGSVTGATGAGAGAGEMNAGNGVLLVPAQYTLSAYVPAAP